ncbi:hypothetical protein ACFVQ9_31910 [Streptomyces goshikiensis]|uniref:hypothetical protein n=1 Tax=Streptomyces goshikiensis TaxID=1942 RepID=UPI0036D1988E
MTPAKDDAPPTLVAARERLAADRTPRAGGLAEKRLRWIVEANALAAIDGKHAPEGGSTDF